MDLDLVEVVPDAKPPVCKIMDFGKYKYKQELREKKAKKKQTQIIIKEIKIRPKIDEHDLETKLKHIKRFLNKGYKVKVSVIFRGRELTHTDIGWNLLNGLAEDVKELGEVESSPIIDGRNMVMLLAPLSKKLKKEKKIAKDENS
jgi:translation initiation factor IF-3